MTENKHADWFLGIDLGTGSCKSIIIDAQDSCSDSARGVMGNTRTLASGKNKTRRNSYLV